jgi:sugar phosphate isomerase/epimerase
VHVGGALWDAWELMEPLDKSAAGFYFDPAHASIEGAKHAWKLNLQRISPRLAMVAIKDYVWEKTAKGWQTRWCPLGEGMVDWPEVFRQLARKTTSVSVSSRSRNRTDGNCRCFQAR